MTLWRCASTKASAPLLMGQQARRLMPSLGIGRRETKNKTTNGKGETGATISGTLETKAESQKQCRRPERGPSDYGEWTPSPTAVRHDLVEEKNAGVGILWQSWKHSSQRVAHHARDGIHKAGRNTSSASMRLSTQTLLAVATKKSAEARKFQPAVHSSPNSQALSLGRSLWAYGHLHFRFALPTLPSLRGRSTCRAPLP